MSLHELLDVQYDASSPDPHSQRRLDLFIPSDLTTAPPLLVFVHGGAWRAGDKSDHTNLARNLAQAHGIAVAAVNYRLTARNPPPGVEGLVTHPGHVGDVLMAIDFLAAWPGAGGGGGGEGRPDLPGKGYDPEMMFFIGHSCGAHILTTLFLLPPPVSSLDLPSPSSQLLKSTKAVLLSEGIYSLTLLLRTFPAYVDFVEPAFRRPPGAEPSAEEYYALCSAENYTLRPGGEGISWWVVHSKGDDLVDIAQPKLMYERLEELFGSLGQDGKGKVRKDWETLGADHYKAVDEPRFSEIVGGMLRSA